MKPSKALLFHPIHSPQHPSIGFWLSVHLFSVSVKREYLCSEVFYHHHHLYYYFYIFKDEFPLASLPLLGYSIGRPVEVRDNQRSTPCRYISKKDTRKALQWLSGFSSAVVKCGQPNICGRYFSFHVKRRQVYLLWIAFLSSILKHGLVLLRP